MEAKSCRAVIPLSLVGWWRAEELGPACSDVQDGRSSFRILMRRDEYRVDLSTSVELQVKCVTDFFSARQLNYPDNR